MIPTRQLLEMFCQALVETEGPGEPDHWEFTPANGWTQFFGSSQDVFVACKDAAGNTVTTYAGPVDYFPIANLNIDTDHGWTDGVLFLTLTGDMVGAGSIFIADQGTGTPQGTLSGEWT